MPEQDQPTEGQQTTPEGTQHAEGEQTQTTTETQSGDPAGLGDAGLRALQAERAARAAAEQQLQALQAQLTSATTRVTELEGTRSTLTGDLATREATITRLQVGLAKGLPEQLIGRLQGADQAALEADADALLALIPTKSAFAPRPDPSQGGRTPAPTTPQAAFVAAMGSMFNS